LIDNNWHHIAVVKSGATINLYADGNLENTQTVSALAQNSTLPLLLGQLSGEGTQGRWKGEIDETRIWTVARSQANIQANLQKTLVGNEAGLAGYYRMDDGNGTTLVDDHSPEVNGTFGSGFTSQLPVWVSSPVPANETYKIDLLRQGNANEVLAIAVAAPGSGEYLWTIPEGITPANDYVIRVTRNDVSALSDESNAPINITAPISLYYVNDGTVNAGDWTTAPGNDANDGLSPGTPKASVAAILAAYDLDAGDSILVDAGNYTLSSNVIITANDSGVVIEGYHDAAFPDRTAVLNRGNTGSGAYVFELRNADDITLNYLQLTGGAYGVFANNTSDSDGLKIQNSRIERNLQWGVFLDQSNDFATITGTRFDNSADQLQQNYHMWLYGTDSVVTNNYLTRAGFDAITVRGARSLIADNDVVNNGRGNSGSGIVVSSSSSLPADRVTVSNNRVSGSTASGIAGDANTLIIGNTVFNQRAGGQTGISSSGEVRDNVVFDNGIGISASQGLIINNRVYHNSVYGINYSGATRVSRNTVYDNLYGIRYAASSPLENNIIYNNQAAGVLVEGATNTPQITNNTIYQPFGNGIQVQSSSANVRVRNNIVWTNSGFAVAVAANSQVNFRSDYNVFNLTGSGSLGQWGTQTIASLVDWNYDLGFDLHSVVGDPQFVDIDGPDNQLGYSRGGGLAVSYFANDTLTGPPVLQRTEPEINASWSSGSPAPEVPVDNFSARWQGFLYVPTTGNYNFYTQADDGVRLYLDGVQVIDQWNYVGFAERTYNAVALATGWHPISLEMRETTGSAAIKLSWDGPGISKRIINADYLGTAVGFSVADFGQDDNFHVLPTSPAVDRGDLATYYLAEVSPNGDRADAGAYGNSNEANISPARSVQILNPNGQEKIEAGQTVNVQFRSTGLTLNRPVALIKAHGPEADNFLADAFRLNGIVTSTTNAINLSGAADPAPEIVYKNYAYGPSGVGAKLSYAFPIPDGNYTLRLHFAEPFYAAGTRIMSIVANGVTVRSNYDINAAAGGTFRANIQELTVGVVGGFGLNLDFVSQTSREGIVSGIEILAANVQGIADPRVDLQYSSDGGIWTTFATQVPMDRFGRGSFNWNVPAGLAEGNYRIRAIHGAAELFVQDSSDSPFSIVNAANLYYVNDNSLVGDLFTTAIGNNANTGKSPSQPMASVSALVAAYDLEPGDVIHVDAGNYTLFQNIVLTAQDSGVRIQGPSDMSATFNRANTSSGSYVIELQNADQVTLDRLQLMGGSHGIFANSTSDSDQLTVSNSLVTLNPQFGIYLDTSNDFLTVSNSSFVGSPDQTQQNHHIWAHGTDALIDHNFFTRAGFDAIQVRGARTVVNDNEVVNNGRGNSGNGIVASNFSSVPTEQITISNNRVSGSTASGIVGNVNTLIIGNTVFNMLIGGQTGISSSGEVRSNVVYDSGIGINANSGLVIGNRVYGNTSYGIMATASAWVTQNEIYDNLFGIRLYGSTALPVSNNNIYDNQSAAVLIDGASLVDFANNTVYQPNGNGIQVQGSSFNVRLRNNILWVQTGSAITVTGDSQTNFQSDYNQFYITGTGSLGQWQGTTFTTHSDWFYQLGLDRNSLVADPQFIDLDGGDNILGFGRGNGLQASYFSNATLTGSATLQRIDPEVNFSWSTGAPAAGLPNDNFSVRWTGFVYVPTAGNYRFYTQADDGVRLYLDGALATDQWNYTGFVENTYNANALTVGFHPIVVEMRETTGSATIRLSWDGPGIGKRIIGPNYLSTTNAVALLDGGQDDNFQVLTTSPSIDRGDVNSSFALEPLPNGGRVNIGSYGNSTFATTSPSQSIQVLSPNGFEKFEVDQTVPISFRTLGLATLRPAALLNMTTSEIEDWQSATSFQITGSRTTIAQPIDLTAISDPAPTLAYSTYAYGDSGIGGKLSYNIPIANGTYDVRLHFVEPSFTTPGRSFSIQLEGNTVAANYDIIVAAGARFKGVAPSFAGIAVSDSFLRVDLTNLTSSAAILSAIEVSAINPFGVASPTANLEFSPDGGTNWNSIATNVPMGKYGKGSFNWTPTATTTGNTGLIRLTANQGSQPQDDSDNPFLVTNNGTEYYISATGNNLNSGKASDQPMMTLAALIDAYDLDPGDTVHVGVGNYVVLRNIRLVAQDSGVTIQGDAANGVTLDRANVSTGRYVFELINSDGTTLDSLEAKGAERGIVAAAGSDSDDFTISNSKVLANFHSGIELGTGNDRLTVLNSKIFGVPAGSNIDDQTYGILIADPSSDALLTGNEVYDNGFYGLFLRGPRHVISSNDIHGNRVGINAFYGGNATDRITIRDNEIHDNTQTGIEASTYVLITGNEIYGQSGINDYGIAADNGVVVSENIIRNNYNGVSGAFNTLTSDNRFYGNSNVALVVNGNAKALGNYIYSNSIGIQGLSNFVGQITNNLIYGNINQGILLQNSSASVPTEVLNNTIYQNVGEAIRLDSSARNVKLYNNLVWVLAGYDIYVATDSQTGFDGDDVNAHVGFWGNTIRDSLADWRTATGKDANSVAADPSFVDIDGADNVLGYVASGGGQHGGLDDNFYRAKNSPAIDRGSSWNAQATDIEGFVRADDPNTPNQGSPQYYPNQIAPTIFGPASVGTAQNWRADDAGWSLTLPFGFNFYGVTYTTAFVSSNGFLQFGGNINIADSVNSNAKLQTTIRIAALWDDLRTDGIGDDIFVDSTVANQITVRWDATNKTDGSDANFGVMLFNNGSFRLIYGAGNTSVTPTVGASSGDNIRYTLSAYSGLTTLQNASSLLYQVQDGQWATNVIGFSSQFSTTSYSAAQALGVPNTLTYGDATTAWAPSTANAGTEFISLGFATPVFSDGIIVRETLGNGFVTKVELIDMADVLHTVFSGVDPSAIGTPVEFQINWPRTDYLVKGAKITINTSLRTTYEEVDAVRLLSTGNFVESNLNTNYFYNFSTTGVAQNWRSDNNVWNWTLPFAFPFYGTNYTSVNVTSNGFLQFASTTQAFNGTNTFAELTQFARIAALWDDLTTQPSNDNIYLDTSVAGRATVRWDATNKADNSDVQFAITLFADGKIQFHYGYPNKNLTPTVGISAGNGRSYQIVPGYDEANSLTNAKTIEYSLAAGISDIGAYEFRGNSADTLAPTIISSLPQVVQSQSVTAQFIDDIRLTFSEEVNPIDARSPAAYELRGAGPNELFDDADDVLYSLLPQYVPGQNTVTLVGQDGTDVLPVGRYRVTVFGGLSSAIHDLAGIRLDGDADSNTGGNYSRVFRVINNVNPVITAANALPAINENELAANISGILIADLIAGQVTDPDGPGLGISVSSASSPNGSWQYSLDGVTFNPIAPQLVGGQSLLIDADTDSRVRFVPNFNFFGTASGLVFAAWDKADNTPEGTVVNPAQLFVNSISTSQVTASVVVNNIASTFVVNTVNDTPDAVPGDGFARDASGNTSLRAAIQESNAQLNPVGDRDTIAFNIPGSGVQTISVLSALPAITEAVRIDGRTAPGYTTAPLVRISGLLSSGTAPDGLRIQGGDSEIYGISITQFAGDGIEVFGAGNVIIAGNFIGIDPANVVAGNANYGLRLTDSPNAMINNNVISGNTRAGIRVVGAASINNTFTNNKVGVNSLGTLARPNQAGGFLIESPNNIIGIPGQGNTVSGNRGAGLSISDTATGTTVQANLIGTNSAGTAAVPNTSYGVLVRSSNNLIGGDSNQGRGNLISGGASHGLVLSGASADNNLVHGNKIGTNLIGNTAIANASFGIFITGGQDNTIGGATAGLRNLVSGNDQSGIVLSGAATSGNLILNNRVGTNVSGLTAIDNNGYGVLLRSGAHDNIVQGNLLSGNINSGLAFTNPTTRNNVARGNLIGTKSNGTEVLANGLFAVTVQAPSNTLGGTNAGDGNVIAGSSRGIAFGEATTQNNVIAGNFIGVDASKTIALGMQTGIQIATGAANNVIGPGNTIAFNGTGIRSLSTAGNGNRVTQNSIYSNTTIGIDIGNAGPTANDANDIDEGPNRGQNTPVIIAATFTAGNLDISYSVPTPVANATYSLTVEFFVTPAGGQGRSYVGSNAYTSVNFTTGTISISLPISGVLIASGDLLTATATDSAGNSSEFSGAFAINVGSSLMAASGSTSPMDVSSDGDVSPLDVLYVIDQLNRGVLLEGESEATLRYRRADVNMDGVVSPLDALLVIDWLTRRGSASEVPVDPTAPVNFDDEIVDQQGLFDSSASLDGAAVDAFFAEGESLDMGWIQRRSRVRKH
jgi:parallel beta-helix repeat protein